jgi:hypothetical protein
MTTEQQINNHIAGQPEAKRIDMEVLHKLMHTILPNGRLWFDNGVNEEGKAVTNPTVGYGYQMMKYAGGKTREFFQIGLSANATGISVYILGIPDKNYLSDTYGKEIGKAKVTGYCIRFRKLDDINIDVLEAAMRYGLAVSGEK